LIRRFIVEAATADVGEEISKITAYATDAAAKKMGYFEAG
jgi:hypothetical protein